MMTNDDDETSISNIHRPLPLHTSRSVPILFRSTSSCSFNSGSNAPEDGVGVGVGPVAENDHQQQHAQHPQHEQKPNHDHLPDADAGDSDSDSDSDSTSNNTYSENGDDADLDEGEDDDTFENACDIEDQATSTVSASSFSMTSFSAMIMGNLSKHTHPHTHTHRSSDHSSLTEEIITSSDSEDAAHVPHLYNARFRSNFSANRPSYSHADAHVHETPSITLTESGSSGTNSKKYGHGKIRRNDCSSSTISSLGTFSKHKHRHLRDHAHAHSQQQQQQQQQKSQMYPLPQSPSYDKSIDRSNPRSTMATIRQRRSKVQVHSSNILAIIKALALFWTVAALSFLFYHVYIYNPTGSTSSSLMQMTMTPLSKLTPGNNLHDMNHIPFPPPEHKISVVLMNHSRPRMIQNSRLVPTLLHHPSVEEVVMLHTNPKTAFKLVHPKVVNIDATQENDQMGLSLRFYFCQLVKNDWVLHLDDDMEFTEKSLNEMLSEFAKNTKRIVGRFGRNRKENSYFNGYSSTDTSKESEVILTKFMVMERETCSAFFKYSHLIWEDIILNNGEGPLWNGEDVFMSLVSNHVYGALSNKINYAMDWLDVTSAPEELKDYSNGKFDISGGFSGLRFWDFEWWRSLLNRNRHYSYRGTLWKEARERLATSGPYVR